MMELRRTIGKALFTAACALLLSGKTAVASDPQSDIEVIQPKTRISAPDFTLANLNHGKNSLTEFKGKVVLLNFWATWCTPCRKEMPAMQALWDKYRDKGFVILAIAVDRGNQKDIASFVKKLDLTYPVLLDPRGDVRKTYEVLGLPMSYLIGKDGRISGKVIGARDWATPRAFSLIEYLIDQDM